MISFFKIHKNKELFVALYFCLFILGLTIGISHSFYNEFRVFEVALLLLFGTVALFNNKLFISKIELLFFGFLAVGSVFWSDFQFVIIELLLAYLLYKGFQSLNYNKNITQFIVLSSFLIFLLFPLSVCQYIATGSYDTLWYPLPWNIRVYDSYFLIMSVFAVWFYMTKQAYRYLYLLFLFLAFFAILLDGGRSATIAYTLFIAIVSMAYRQVRWELFGTYVASWLAYLSITYAASLAVVNSGGGTGLRIARESSSGRIDLWVNALQCWSQNPIIGCGFYQLEDYPNLSAHPHNLFIQVLTETGLLGFGFLLYIIFMIIKRIDWSQPQRYFVSAAFLAIGVDLFFSGVHIYPVTQMALLWLFVFLLKNPEFIHSKNINSPILQGNSSLVKVLPILIYLIISFWFIYILSNTNALSSETPITPPRFWVYGYQL